jgi:hypothetical protein
MNIRKILIGALAALTLTAGMASTASAQICYPNGYCVCVWHSVWIQTGPYVGQGYWTQVCD